ncbi:hypothetical protein CJ030_MR7G026009 [Morella rubra]|uniref:Uncharacterized protein n=1 Tax=Morella rubra TaxID=262757 RepID=A0A6A1UZJ9_9ROSI|nr:hypothetical protein CJ030_MR7G026009 [Morella rubra]
MDFHSLARKELQALCKKNKIPANMTNVAMADALQALQQVEGLEEILNPSDSNLSKSPEKIVIGPPDIPPTASRTSIRRKPIKEESESTQLLTRSRRGTRRKTAEDINQENKDVNVLSTPAIPSSRRRAPAASACRNIDIQLREDEEEKKIDAQGRSDAPETPAVPSSRRRGPAARGPRKLEAQNEENSAQQLGSTRRSVRLLEKNMAKLSIIENVKGEPVKIHELFEETTNDSDRSEVSVEVGKRVCEVESEITDELEVLSDPKSDGSPEIETESEVDCKDKNKSVDESELDVLNSKQELATVISDNLGAVKASEAIDEAHDERSGELEVISNEKLEKAIDVDDESVDDRGPADAPVIEQVTVSEDSLTVEVPNDISAEVEDLVIAYKSLQVDSAGVEETLELNLLRHSSSDVQDECQNLASKDSDIHVPQIDGMGSYDSGSEYSTEVESDKDKLSSECEDSNSDDDAETEMGSDDSGSEYDTEVESDEVKLSNENSSESEEKNSEDDVETEMGSDDSGSEYGTEVESDEDKLSGENSSECQYKNSDDVAETERKDSEVPTSQNSKEESDPLVTKSNIPDVFDPEGNMTEGENSGSKSIVNEECQIQVSENEGLNDDYAMAPCPVQNPVSKMETDSTEKYADKSLRQLKKLAREKEIATQKEKNKGQNETKEQVGKKRIALQTLPENRIEG